MLDQRDLNQIAIGKDDWLFQAIPIAKGSVLAAQVFEDYALIGWRNARVKPGYLAIRNDNVAGFVSAKNHFMFDLPAMPIQWTSLSDEYWKF
jgi:hypothetical protein